MVVNKNKLNNKVDARAKLGQPTNCNNAIQLAMSISPKIQGVKSVTIL